MPWFPQSYEQNTQRIWKKMKAIIFAAGRGIRLRPLTREWPKCLLKINNKTILERLLIQLFNNNIKQIIIVVGHKKEKIYDEVSKIDLPIDIKFVSNDIYDKTNTLYSLWVAKDELTEGYIQIDGDLICDDELIKKLVKMENGLIVDTSQKVTPEEIKVMVKNSKIIAISQDLDPKQCHGESIGIYKFSKENRNIVFEELKKFVDRNEINVYYENAFQNIIKKMDIGFVKTEGYRWSEIDTPEDYEEAKKMFECDNKRIVQDN